MPETKYRVLEASDKLSLSALVDEYLKKSYMLVGGVSVAMHEDDEGNRYLLYAQAVIPATIVETVWTHRIGL